MRNRLVSDFSSRNMTKVIEVPKGDKRLHGFDAYVDYKNKNDAIIYNDKTQPAVQKRASVYHEKGHIACRQVWGKDKYVEWDKKSHNELKRFHWYKEMKEGHTHNRMPEEMLCELYGQYKAGLIKESDLKWFAKKYPQSTENLKRMAKETGLKIDNW